MREFWGMRCTSLLPFVPGPLWSGVATPDRVLSLGLTELNHMLMLNWTFWNRTVLAFKLCTYAKQVFKKELFRHLNFVLMLNWIFIIMGFRTIVFIFIVISTTFRSICPPAFFWCLSNSGTFTELRTTSFIESTVVACSDSVSHNRVQVLSIPVLLLACIEDWTCNLQMIVYLEA